MIPGLDSILGGGGLALGSAASAQYGPVSGAPVSVNVAGFGSKASGSASQVPAAASGAPMESGASYLVPAAIAAGVVLLLVLLRD